MGDVTKYNFLDKLDEIEENIAKSCFIAFDTEFSGLQCFKERRPSLFDSADERYDIIRLNASKFTITQFGLCTFEFVKDENKYIANTYNFYIFPQSYGVADSTFLCQASSFEFLRHNGFDFNRLVYEGLSYVNKSIEAELRKRFDAGILFSKADYRDCVDEHVLQAACSKVAQWLAARKESTKTKPQVRCGACIEEDWGTPDTNKDDWWLKEERLIVDNLVTDNNENDDCDIAIYILVVELKARFPEIKIARADDDRVLIVTLSDTEANGSFEESDSDTLALLLLKKVIGFSTVFNMLVKSKKPIVGHNCFTDLVMMYNCFYKPLPAKFSQFKKEILAMFPLIFDTKHISHSLRKKFEDVELFKANSLSLLFEELQRAAHSYIYSPKYVLGQQTLKYVNRGKLHEAGYDAYLCGVVFLLTCHFETCANRQINGQQMVFSPLTPIHYFRALTRFNNKLNVIRGQINYVDLIGRDPPSARPKLLVVESKIRQKYLDVEKLIYMLSMHGTVDVRLRHDKKSAFVAIGNFRNYRDICRAFRDDREFQFMTYSRIHHSSFIRTILWSAFALSSSASLFGLYLALTKR